MERKIWGGAVVLLVAAMALSGPALAGIGELGARGVALSVEGPAITVSGVSSGAAMAHQLHLIHSAEVKGAGLVAGPPYRCAGLYTDTGVGVMTAGEVNATTLCTNFYRDIPMLPYVKGTMDAAGKTFTLAGVEALTKEALAQGGDAIDDRANLCGSRVYTVAGGQDATVPQTVTSAVDQLYASLFATCRAEGKPVVEPKIETKASMPHTMPTDRPPHPGACAAGPPYIAACDFAAGSQFLDFFHPERVAKAEAKSRAKPANLIAFDQRRAIGPYLHNNSYLHDRGYLYIPDACRAGAPCPLHVALHGCSQNQDMIGKGALFARDAGYNDEAERLGVIVLYPQARKGVANPRGCWDWWGYSGADYYTKQGAQVRALWALVDAVRKP